MTDISLSQTLVFGHIWQSVAIAAVLAGALILGKRMRGSTRYGLGLAAFAASLVLPLAAFIPGETIVTSLLKQLNAPVSIEQPLLSQTINGPSVAALPASPASPAPSVAGALFPVNFVASPAAPAAPAAPASVNTATRAALFTLPALPLPDIGLPLLFIWLGVATFLIVRTVRDLLAVERLVARARPADMPEALKARMNGVRVVVSPDAPGPMAAGLLHPAIVLPESIALASPGMAALLEHEYAHIRRRDMLAALGQRIVLALLWWSPALYWISRRMDEEREVACDEAAVDRTGDARAFARSLTTQAENQLWVRAPRLAVGAIGPRSQFGRRIRRLIDMAKTGGAPAKYSGRLAFAGLAVAIGVAAMITPRFTAEAQPPEGAIDITKPNKAKSVEIAKGDGKLDGAAPGSHDDIDFQWDGKDFAGLGKEIESMLADLQPELEALGAEFGPQMQSDLQGLSTELAALGVDISSMVNQEVISRMPEIMDEVRRSLDAAAIDMEQSKEWRDMSEEERDQARAELQQAREEMKRAFGPEMRDEIRRALAEARAELANHREEIAAALREGNAGMAEARAAIAAARQEIDAARARGDFDHLKDMKFDFNFEHDVMDQLRKAGIELDGAKGMKMSMHRDGKTDRLIDAADECDVAEINKLIMNEKADANAMLPGQGSALMAAAESNCADAARALINAGADVNAGFPGRGTPLSIAVSNSSEPVVDLLLSRGANPDAAVPGRHPPLVEAIHEGQLDIVKALVAKGASVNLKTPMTGMRTPLDIAISEDEEEIANFLKSKGAITSRSNH